MSKRAREVPMAPLAEPVYRVFDLSRFEYLSSFLDDNNTEEPEPDSYRGYMWAFWKGACTRTTLSSAQARVRNMQLDFVELESMSTNQLYQLGRIFMDEYKILVDMSKFEPTHHVYVGATPLRRPIANYSVQFLNDDIFSVEDPHDNVAHMWVKKCFRNLASLVNVTKALGDLGYEIPYDMDFFANVFRDYELVGVSSDNFMRYVPHKADGHPFAHHSLTVPLNDFQVNVSKFADRVINSDVAMGVYKVGPFFIEPFKGGGISAEPNPRTSQVGFICGATGSGKTLAALNIADGGVIICDDSLVPMWEKQKADHVPGSTATVISKLRAVRMAAETFDNYRVVFVDEAHAMTKAMHGVLSRVRVPVFLLTATPYQNFALTSKLFGRMSRDRIIVSHMITSREDVMPDIQVVKDVVRVPLSPEAQIFMDGFNRVLRSCDYNAAMRNPGAAVRMLMRIFSSAVIPHVEESLVVLSNYLSPPDDADADDLPVFRGELFWSAEDRCAVCFNEPMEDPVCFQCGHAYCRECASALRRAGMRCPACRQPVTGVFSMQVRKPSPPTESRPHVIRTKIDKVIECYRQSPPDKLVIYVRDYYVATELQKELGGLILWKRKDAGETLRAFEGPEPLLFISSGLCSGLDIPFASHLWVVDLGLDSYVLTQSLGRIFRFSQRAPTIYFKIFVFELGFDDFLWHSRYLRTMSATKSTIILYAYFLHVCFRNVRLSALHNGVSVENAEKPVISRTTFEFQRPGKDPYSVPY